MLAVRWQRKLCRRFVDVSAARRSRQTTKHAVQIERGTSATHVSKSETNAQFTSPQPTQFPPLLQTRQNSPVCVVSGVAIWIGQLLLTCPDFKFSVDDSLELSGIQFTPPKRTRHRQDSFVVSGVAVWISFNYNIQASIGQYSLYKSVQKLAN